MYSEVGFHMVLYPGEIGIWKCWSLIIRRKETPSTKTMGTTNNRLNPHIAPGWNQNWATLVERDHSCSCAIPALQIPYSF